MQFTDFVALAARLFEAAGVGVMVVGSVAAVGLVAVRYRGTRRRDGIRVLRHHLGSAILLGLELLVAADIIRTVAESPTLQQVLILGLIVLIRTFLSFTLEVEIEGRWPWQQGRQDGECPDADEAQGGGREPPPP
ncbi:MULTISPECIES: DUF1622 domain-containing protein [unclassified Corallococcus]|uniref:DUF1622 domain-containing protein n=1 Tax=unclassified Corallococcus TaxID=2685029 RepID=UPI000EA3F1F5|nr:MULTISPECIES: DUF1622 domain-containing protein [unclassified Corallococcus]RKH12231.1 DUF1622 domain-containing protein [Corallococcus sp. CA047B]RKH17042.1 DUF1622 domain-containing protein [Corallococcus sp. CA031C]